MGRTLYETLKWHRVRMKVIPIILSIILFSGLLSATQAFASEYQYNFGKIEIRQQGTEIGTLKAQLESGVERHEIICRNGLYLLYKTSDGSPVCVEEYFSAPKLVDRGWATLGETSLVITTDKDVYSLGEKISITMENDGETLLVYSGPIRFFILDESENDVEYSTDTHLFPTENLLHFDTLSSLSFVWDQTTKNAESVKPGIYTISTRYMQPVPSIDLLQLNHQWVETTKTFEIVDEAFVEPIVADNVIDANNQFAINFYSGIAQGNNDNIFFSPWSISTAFAIAYEGAKEKTADEIQQVFGFPDDYNTRTSEFQSAIASLNPEDALYQLSVANALWLDADFTPFPEYVDTATTYYDSEVSTVEFDGNEGVDKINAWVEEKTNEKIKDILVPGSTNELTRLAITNAIYFKGNWVTQFNENNTRDDPFWITLDESVEVPMMQLENAILNFTQTENMQVLRMPYEGDRLSMLVLLPNDKDGLSELEESLTVENLKQWNDQLNPGQIHVYMPKFKLETTYDLVGPLSAMGMPTPFFEGVADFGGITSIHLFISQAIHKAFVDVNEEGTEAAAATVIMMMTTSEKPPTPIFRADHPFVFLIQDDSTGNILFIGRMMEPPQES